LAELLSRIEHEHDDDCEPESEHEHEHESIPESSAQMRSTQTQNRFHSFLDAPKGSGLIEKTEPAS